MAAVALGMASLGNGAGAPPAAGGLRSGSTRLPPDVNRALYVRNLPFNITTEELFEIFGKFGAIRQIRLGSAKTTKGTAYVVYEDIFDAKNAQEHLSGFNVANRYLIVLYHKHTHVLKKAELREQEAVLKEMQRKHGVDGEEPPPKKPKTEQ